jgi:hypothetical protein
MTPFEKAHSILLIVVNCLQKIPRPHEDTVPRVLVEPSGWDGWMRRELTSPSFYVEDLGHPQVLTTLTDVIQQNVKHIYEERYEMLAHSVPEAVDRESHESFTDLLLSRPFLTPEEDLLRFDAEGREVPLYLKTETSIEVNPDFVSSPYRDEIYVCPGWLTEHVYLVEYPESPDKQGVVWSSVSERRLAHESLNTHRGDWSVIRDYHSDGPGDGGQVMRFRGLFCYKHVIDRNKISRIRKSV